MVASGIKVGEADIIDSIRKHRGVIAHAARHLRCSRQTIYECIRNSEEAQAALEEGRKALTEHYSHDDRDLVEKARNSLHMLVERGDITATIFALKSKGDFVQQSDYRGDIVVHVDSKPFRRLKQGPQAKCIE